MQLLPELEAASPGNAFEGASERVVVGREPGGSHGVEELPRGFLVAGVCVARNDGVP